MICITGANGLIGRAITRAFLEQNVPLRLAVRQPAHIRTLFPCIDNRDNVEVIECDLSSIENRQLDALLAGCSTVIHTAGVVHRKDATAEEYERLNIKVTEQLGEAARNNGCTTFLYLSSIAVYGRGPLVNVSETETMRPTTPYALSKARAEEYLFRCCPAERTIILRPSLVFGEGDRGNMLSLIRQVLSGRYCHISDGNTYKSIIYSRDAAQAILGCLENLEAGMHVFNLSNPQPVSLHNLAGVIATAGGANFKFRSLPKTFLLLAAKTAEAVLGNRSPMTVQQIETLSLEATCSTARLVEKTRFSPYYSLLEALKSEIDWARERGHLV